MKNPTPACRRMLARVSAYLDGELDAADCRTIERHCRTCPDCATLIGGLRSAVGLCHEAGERPLPPALRRRARLRIRRLLGD